MLKSLELFGFKSFADRTRFDFSTGINCVVGPNGSGKSNVVDGMKWILGDQSAKSLRGKEMTDVIFNGSASRKASAFAEATLTFDNTSGLLPLDMPEVHIGRRIWRNGDAEYLLNRAPARLKDIRDLFLGTGAGSAAYSIIEQGRVDQILQGNSASRRAVFEEAAGISRFKARKVEAQRKLERVAQNLERLTDIVDEVEAQLNSTRSQASKAAKFRDVSTALKKWWLGLAADDFRQLTAEREGVAQQLVESSERLEELNEQQKAFEEREAAFDSELTKLDDKIREVEKRSSSDREAIAGHETTIQFQSARLKELETEIVRLQKQQMALGRREHDMRFEIESHRQQLTETEADYSVKQLNAAENDRRVQATSDELTVRRDELDRDRTRHLELTRLSSTATNTVSTLNASIATLQSSQQKVVSQLDAMDGTIAERELERTNSLNRTEEAAQNQAAALQSLRQTQVRRANLLGAQEDAKQKLAELRERRSAAQARKSLLEDLELRQEGLGIGVKDILNRAKSSAYPPWNTIVGSVADLLDVDLDRAALLEVALGSRSQLIVLREYQAFLDYLNQGTVLLTNRVGFIAIPERFGDNPMAAVKQYDRFVHLQLDPDSLPDLSREEGVIMRADGLVLSDRGTVGLAAAVLADTWIVRTMEDAVRLAIGAGKGLRFVTMQGEMLEANGTLFVGNVRSETSLLSRKSELRRLKNDLTLLDRDIESTEQHLQSMYQSLTGADSELESMAAELDYANQRLSDLKAELANLDQTLERLRRERRVLSDQMIAAEDELNRLVAELDQAQQQASSIESELQHLTDKLAVSAEALVELETLHRQYEQQRSDDQLALVKQAERLESLHTQVKRMEDDLQQRIAQHEEAERRSTSSIGKRAQIVLQILNTRTDRDERMYVAEAIQEEALRLSQEKMALRVERGQIVEQELILRKQRRELADRHHSNEIRARDIDTSLVNLNERLEEEYQLTLAEVVESGVSSLAFFLEERKTKGSSTRGKGRKEREEDSEIVEVSESDLEPSDDPLDQAVIQLGEDETASENRSIIESDELTVNFAEVRPEIEAKVNRLRKQLKLMGSVNTDSLRDLEMQETRYTQLAAQLQDLVEAKQTLDDIIRKINAESRRLFQETFETIRKNFQDLFRQVFGGGEGDIILEDPNDILDCGIDIAARPPGKELRSISLLSGGEKTMTAIALIMSIFKSKPSPFCILDEVDAALDEANVERFTAVVKAFQQSTQFIMITHHKRSMTVADVLYGVTMEESGISKRMSVRFEDVSDDGHFKSSSQSSAA